MHHYQSQHLPRICTEEAAVAVLHVLSPSVEQDIISPPPHLSGVRDKNSGELKIHPGAEKILHVSASEEGWARALAWLYGVKDCITERREMREGAGHRVIQNTAAHDYIPAPGPRIIDYS